MLRLRPSLFLRWATSPWLIFSLCLIVQAPFVWSHMHDVQLAHRFPEHAAIARSLLNGQGYGGAFPNTSVPTAWFAPIFTFFLLVLFKHFTVLTSARIVMALNLLFSSATAAAIFVVGKDLVRTRAAAVAAWMWVFWYYCAVFPVLLDETNLTALLLMLGIWGLLKVQRSRQFWSWVGFGILWGFGCLLSPALFSILFFYWVCLLVVAWRGIVVWRLGILGSILAFAVTLAPWVIRNYARFDRFIFVRSDLPAEMYFANHEGLGSAPADYSSFPAADPAEYQRLGEPAYMDKKKALLVDFVRKHPGEFAHRTVTRIVNFWVAPRGSGMWFVSAGAFVGLVLAMRNLRAKVFPLAIPMVFFPLVYYFAWAFPRHRHPIEPVIFLLFGYMVDQLVVQVGHVIGKSTPKLVESAHG